MMTTRFLPVATRHIGGFSLLEVLVALFVLSIGLLGLAGLQTFSLKFNHQSYESTQATLLLQDMANRITANPQGAQSGDYVIGTGPASSVPGYGACPTTCSATQLARYDIFQWKSILENGGVIAGGTGSIAAVPGPPGAVTYQITINWMEDGSGMSQSLMVRTL